MSELIITLRHMRTVPGMAPRAGYCLDGARAWAAQHGIDWHDFIHNGVAASRLEAIGDPFAKCILAHARHVEAQR